ncbi:MAG TPA: hypothetical protein VHP33_12740 [Polyangiaceae bacterium]|nr:hypothetical protein [Polyangiaceae bacterium]
MAFAVSCKSCQARFLLNDDLLRRKVAGRVVTVRCRQCHAPIEVDASEVDPKTLPEAVKPEPAKPMPKAPKPAPLPPRPAAKSTLMGIGAPRPGPATELVALSPGFLNMSAPAPTAPAAPIGARGFPEPPPPPGAVIEELSASDWEITETPPLAKADNGPESVDDFIEELPPSLPPPDEELPSSTGTPSLKALAHHDEQPQKPHSDDFLANMSAAMNGGIMAGTPAGAPTIDVSAFATEPAASDAPSIDVSLLDVPLEGKQTLPLFALTGDAPAAAPAPAPAARPQPPTHARPAPSPSGGSLSPSAVDRPAREGDDSPRERKNVVAPATNSVPPAASGQRRSGLAAPVLLALAVAAGFLIWKRSSGHGDPLAQAEEPKPAVEAPRAPAPPTPAPTPEATIAAVPAAPSPTTPANDDITFETAPNKPAAPSAVINKPSGSEAATAATPSPAAEKPAAEKPVAEKPAAETKPESATPAVKEPAPPSGEPAGPFDRAAASAALNSSAAQASSCRKEGDPSGVASVTITFAPSGRVTSANISGPPFAGTPTGGCIAAALRKARVPAFDGDRVTVSKTVVIQ